MKTRYSDASESPGFLLWRTTLAWQRAIARALRPHGLTHVQFVLLASLGWLAGHEGAPTQSRLAEHAGIDRMMTSKVIRTLEQRGLVERAAADGRTNRVSETKQGKRLLAKALKDVENADETFFAAAPNRRELLRGLRSLAPSAA